MRHLGQCVYSGAGTQCYPSHVTPRTGRNAGDDCEADGSAAGTNLSDPEPKPRAA